MNRNELYGEFSMLPDPSFGMGKVPEGSNEYQRRFKRLSGSLKRRDALSEQKLRDRIAEAYFPRIENHQ